MEIKRLHCCMYTCITNILIQLIGPTLTSVWCVHVQVCVIKYHEICISIQVPNLHCCINLRAGTYQKYTQLWTDN